MGGNLTGQYWVPNNTFFNSDDRITTSGYVKTVTIRYQSKQIPTTATRIWIYIIVSTSGGYLVCSQHLVPISQITTNVIQMYTFDDNAINVHDGAYVGIGVLGTGSISGTYGGLCLNAQGADQLASIKTCTTIYFKADVSKQGAHISYTIVA